MMMTPTGLLWINENVRTIPLATFSDVLLRLLLRPVI
jgi:hypothetical protein